MNGFEFGTIEFPMTDVSHDDWLVLLEERDSHTSYIGLYVTIQPISELLIPHINNMGEKVREISAVMDAIDSLIPSVLGAA